MKSLEIVNKKINYCEEQEVPCVSMRLVSLQQIKQDLEVLEIIKEMIFERVGYYKIKGNLPKYRTITIRDNDDRFIKIELSEEQLLKLKQWLEVNENELGN